MIYFIQRTIKGVFAGTGIRCNAIAPGFLVSAQNKALLFNEDGTPTKRFVDAGFSAYSGV